MDAGQLVQRVSELLPGSSPVETLRMALLVAQEHDAPESLATEAALQAACQNMGMKLSAASDQHAAVAVELDNLGATQPCDFSPDHLWTLVRAIKVQSQILNLYLGSRANEPSHLG